MTTKIKQNQTLFDIAINCFGDANIAFEIARINNISVSDTLEAGRELLLPNYTLTKSVDVATGTSLPDSYFTEKLSKINRLSSSLSVKLISKILNSERIILKQQIKPVINQAGQPTLAQAIQSPNFTLS
jgi:hypothetical protein